MAEGGKSHLPSTRRARRAQPVEQPIDFRRQLEALRRNARAIVVGVAAVTAVVLALSLTSGKSYQAVAEIVALGSAGDGVATDAASIQRRLSTVESLVGTRDVLQAAARRLPEETASSLEDKVRSSVDTQADVIKIATTDSDSRHAADVANATAQAVILRDRALARKRTAQVRASLRSALARLAGARDARTERGAIRQRLGELAVGAAGGGYDLQIAERAQAPSRPSSPRPLRNAVLALFVSLFIAILLALWRDRLLSGPSGASRPRRGHDKRIAEDAPPAARPRRSERGQSPYLRAIGAHRLLIPVAVWLALIAAFIWLEVREPRYIASAQILVTPLPNDPAFVGPPLLRESSDPERAPQTAAALIQTTAAARLAARGLGEPWTVSAVSDAVRAEPLGDTSLVRVTAEAGDPREAARVANIFAAAALEARGVSLRRDVARSIRTLEAQLARMPSGDPDRAEIRSRMRDLEGLRTSGDPTLSLAQRAAPPEGAEGVPAWLVITLAAVGGLVVGTAAALLVDIVSPRIRDGEEVRRAYPLPVLAELPRVPGRGGSRRGRFAARPPPGAVDAFRALAARLIRDGGKPAIMITSGSSGDGKTTCAIGIAVALADARQRTILIERDARNPALARELGILEGDGPAWPGGPEANLRDALQHVPWLPELGILSAGGALPWQGTGVVADLLDEAHELADYVILDATPLVEVGDALTIVGLVDDVIVVVRPGHTNRVSFELTRDLLERAGITPMGVVIVGEERARHGAGAREDWRSARTRVRAALRSGGR